MLAERSGAKHVQQLVLYNVWLGVWTENFGGRSAVALQGVLLIVYTWVWLTLIWIVTLSVWFCFDSLIWQKQRLKGEQHPEKPTPPRISQVPYQIERPVYTVSISLSAISSSLRDRDQNCIKVIGVQCGRASEKAMPASGTDKQMYRPENMTSFTTCLYLPKYRHPR